MSTSILAHYPHRRAAHGLHRCGDCGGRIAARDLYSDQRLACDGTAYTFREHALCRELFEEAWAAGYLDEGDRYDATDMDLPESWRPYLAPFAPRAAPP